MSSKHSSKHSKSSSRGTKHSSKTSSKSKSSRHLPASGYPALPSTEFTFGQKEAHPTETWTAADEAEAGYYDTGEYTGMPFRGPVGDGVEDEGGDFGYYVEGDLEDDLDGNDSSDQHQHHYPDSISSSVKAHVYEGGLRYHAYHDGRYAFPNDDVEQNRDDMKHQLTLQLCDKKYFHAPVKDRLAAGAQVLDLGTGTGIWVIQLADKYPKSFFSGIDLSPIQPADVPPRVTFAVDDFEDEWVYPENHFDFIHMRHCLHSARDREQLLKRAYKHLKPGGYLEFQEFHYWPHADDSSLDVKDKGKDDKAYALRDFCDQMREGLAALGSDLDGILYVGGEMEAAGFIDVGKKSHKAPIGGAWPQDERTRNLASFHEHIILDGLPGLVKRPLGNGLGWSPVQIEVFLVGVRKAIQNPKFHAYFPLNVVYGRKPGGSPPAKSSSGKK